jgi:hypothetical protein
VQAVEPKLVALFLCSRQSYDASCEGTLRHFTLLYLKQTHELTLFGPSTNEDPQHAMTPLVINRVTNPVKLTEKGNPFLGADRQGGKVGHAPEFLRSPIYNIYVLSIKKMLKL